jgi:hypothetical protein
MPSASPLVRCTAIDAPPHECSGSAASEHVGTQRGVAALSVIARPSVPAELRPRLRTAESAPHDASTGLFSLGECSMARERFRIAHALRVTPATAPAIGPPMAHNIAAICSGLR